MQNNTVKAANPAPSANLTEVPDLSLDDLLAMEASNKRSLGVVCGWEGEKLEVEWFRINLDAQFEVQFNDIRIDEL